MLDYLKSPKFLTPIDETNGEDDFSVLTDRATIRNLIENICNTLHHPVTILDFNRLVLENINDNEYRIDSEIEVFSLRYACKLLRQCAGVDRCIKCDKFHASCMDTKAELIKDKINAAIPRKPDFFYEEYVNNLPKVLSEFDRPVVEYYCPMLGYRELLFPINYSGNILGVLFVGQIIVESEGDKERMKKTIDSFFAKSINAPQQIFKRHIETSKEKKHDITGDMIVDLIKKSDDILIPFDEILNYDKDAEGVQKYYSKNFKTKADYIHFIEKTCKTIDDIEKKLNAIFYTKQKNYFYKLISQITNVFFKNYSDMSIQIHGTDTHKNRKKELDFVWNELLNIAKNIKETFGFEDITIFGDGNSVNIIETSEKKVYPPRSIDKSEWFYNFSFVDQYLPTAYDYTTSVKKPKILNGLSKNISKDRCVMILFHDMAILIKRKISNHDETLYKILLDAIGDNLSKINNIIALCTANFMKERHVLTLRMNRHESAHISTRLNDSMKRYFANSGKNFIIADSEKQKLVVEDMQNTIQLISHMANNIGLITGSINENNVLEKIKYLDVYDLLYKWQIMFRNELKGRNLDIIILRNSDNDVRNQILQDAQKFYRDGPRYTYINSELFELLVYNLVDNAVKYAHRGSKIYLSWHKTYNDFDELTVTSFGPQMEDGDALYELYARGSTAQLHVASGDGIGLYAVKRIAQLLKLDVAHTSNYISKYNIPIIPWYIKESFDPSYQEERQNICNFAEQEYREVSSSLIINNNEYTSIVRRDLSKEYLIKRISRQTWNTTFRVRVKDIET